MGRGKINSGIGRVRAKAYLFEQLEPRSMVQAGLTLLDGFNAMVWWNMEPAQYDQWDTLQISGDGGSTWNTLVQIDPNGGGVSQDYMDGNNPFICIAPDGYYVFGLDGSNAAIQLGQTYDFEVTNQQGGVFSFSAATPQLGDANNDGTVDQNDLQILINAYNNNQDPSNDPLLGWSNGDFNFDGTIDEGDFDIVAQQGVPAVVSVSLPDASSVAGQTSSVTLDYSDQNVVPLDFWTVDWGDGSDPQIIPNDVNVATHTWADSGNYNVNVAIGNAATQQLDGGVANIGSQNVEVSRAIDDNLGVPAEPSVSLNDDATATLTWPEVTGADGYRIEASYNGGSYQTLGSVPAGTDTNAAFTTPNLPAHVNASVRVITTAGAKDSHASAAHAFTTRPAAPSNLVATKNGNTQVDLTWTDNSAGAAQTDIMMSSDDGQTFQRIATVDQGVTAYSAAGLDPQGVYQFQTRAYQRWDSDPADGRRKPKTAPTSSSLSGPSNTQTTAMLPGGSLNIFKIFNGNITIPGSQYGASVSYQMDGGNSDGITTPFSDFTVTLSNLPPHTHVTLTADVRAADVTNGIEDGQLTISAGGNTLISSNDIDAVAQGDVTIADRATSLTFDAHIADGDMYLGSLEDFDISIFRPTVSIYAIKGDATEVDDPSLQFQVSRDGPTDDAIDVNVGQYYGTKRTMTGLSGNVTILQGSPFGEKDGTLLDDDIPEGDEAFTLPLEVKTGDVYAVANPNGGAGGVDHDDAHVTNVTFIGMPSKEDFFDQNNVWNGKSWPNWVAGFNFHVYMIVSGEHLDKVHVTQKITSHMVMYDATGNPSQPALNNFINQLPAGESVGVETNGQNPIDTGWSDQGLTPVPDEFIKAGLAQKGDYFTSDHQNLNVLLGILGTGGQPPWGVSAALVQTLTRDFTDVFFNNDTKAVLTTKNWHVYWNNKNSQWNNADPDFGGPFPGRALAKNGLGKGTLDTNVGLKNMP